MSEKNYLLEYWELIRTKKIAVSKHIYMVYKRLAGEITKPKKDFKYVFSTAHANHAVDFIETYCRHSKGEWVGTLVKLELFQKAALSAIFGFLHKKTGLRRFREVLFLVARKNGKSTFASGIMLYLLMADGEGGAEIYSVATKKDQAKIIFAEACNMVRQMKAYNKELTDAILKKHKTDLEFVPAFAKFEPLSAEADTLDGLNSHGVAIDELHAIKSFELYEVMGQSVSARQQPLILMVTTAGTQRASIFDERYAYAVAVAEWQNGFRDDEFLPLLYELDHKDEWKKPKMWIKANPGLGTIKKREYLQKKVEEAKRSPRLLPGVLCKDFNIKSTDTTAWLTFESALNKKVADIEYLKNSYAIGGCDLSATTDLTCATLLIRKPDDNHIYVLQQYFLPQSKIDKLEVTTSKEAPYKLWADQGYVTVCEGSQVDYKEVTQWFVKMVKEHNIRPLWICYDRALAGYWVPEMEDYGFVMEKTAQGPFTWSQPMKEMGAAFDEHLIVYQNNPVLFWCLTNTGAKARNSDGIATIQPVKLSEPQRIDGTVSLLNAYVGYVKYFSEYMKHIK